LILFACSFYLLLSAYKQNS